MGAIVYVKGEAPTLSDVRNLVGGALHLLPVLSHAWGTAMPPGHPFNAGPTTFDSTGQLAVISDTRRRHAA
ncbi:hypothetical protein ADK76_19840 [Streptomyces griseoflavus]|uniref:hypothetical protein n=1 Tax=Streptomyces rimosus TaxID=1927 RepID=UPI00069D3BFD|nr:hypothetical protein [Streptomyces rimosus]KOG56285.1 hypothetical protein ADK76_19840 [Streptomyces griseoflavus]